MRRDKNTQRKRGVRASRAKLTAALAACGLRTQAALAERIADLEGLDAPPKDVVNRIFRELPAEATSLARVARALGVEAHTLYLTSDEEVARTGTPPAVPAAPASSMSRRRLAFAAFCFCLLAGAGWWFGASRPGSDTTAAADVRGPRFLDLGDPTLVVMPISGDPEGALADAVRAALSRDFSVAARTAAVVAGQLDAGGAADRLRADVALEGEIVHVGRLLGLRFFLLANKVRQQVWAQSVPAVALEDALATTADDVAHAVREATGRADAGTALPHFPLVPAQDDYLMGEYYLDRPSNELNLKRAQSRFAAALRQDSNYASAHAGLCQTLLEEHWMSDEERALHDAARACGRALQLAPDDPVVASAHAHFLRRTGRNDEAIRLYETIVARSPKDAAALAGLASSLLTAYQQGGGGDYLERAKATARRAAAADPYVWKPLFALGTMEWFDGDVAAAIAATEDALARDENEYVLANLGTFYVCDGEFAEGRAAYLRARQLAPQSYVGDEFLGTAYYFLGDFAESARLRQRAIDSIAEGAPEIHEMWGALAESYRQLGDDDAAIAAYLRAAEIAERDYLRGNAPVDDRAARAYYYTVLGTLDETLVPDAIARSIGDELDGIASEVTSATAHRRLAQTYLLRGERDAARAALDRATSVCRGFAAMPDLAELRASGTDAP